MMGSTLSTALQDEGMGGQVTGAILKFSRSSRRLVTAWLALVFGLMSLMFASRCYAADVVVLRASSGPSWQVRQLDVAAQFYGLSLRSIVVNGADAARALQLAQQPQTLAIAIEAEVLRNLNQRAVLQAVHRASGLDVPILLFGFSPSFDPGLLSTWSGGAVLSTTLVTGQGHLEYRVGDRSEMTGQLAGIALPITAESAWHFVLSASSQTSVQLSVHSASGVYPIFIQAHLSRERVFLLCGSTSDAAEAQWNATDVVGSFAAVAPMMMFLRNAAGDLGWHTPHLFANLTIDDPWLHEPYGHLDYTRLLEEMDRHNFHTTIAFIPWNYDRSEPKLAALFRSRPDRYTISVHGDNHDHKEFDGFGDRSLDQQNGNLKQALARMDEFKKLTGIQYDHTFVFPHSIGEGAVFKALKTYNYTATFNSTNVPMDGAPPKGPLFWLRPVTTAYYGFPSVLRVPPTIPNRAAFVKIQQFLGNPLLFYTHEGFFAAGISAFDCVADEVNRSEPATEWRGLGDIAAHLYLVRRIRNSSYDIFTFSSNIRLENNSSKNRAYSLTKDEGNPSQIASVEIDGQQTPYKIQDGLLHMTLTVPAGQTRNVAILYRNDLKTAPVDIAKKSVRVYLLRTASDFRDIWLSRAGMGDAVTALYYRYNGSPRRVLALAILFVVSGAGVVWILLFSLRAKTPSATTKNDESTDTIATHS